jgi:hypothetical protein
LDEATVLIDTVPGRADHKIGVKETVTLDTRGPSLIDLASSNTSF